MNTGFCVKNVRIVDVDAEKIIPGMSVVIKNGSIHRIDKISNVTDDIICIDGEGNYLLPGFIDLHIHGVGNSLLDRGPDDLSSIRSLLPRYGVTAFLPTLVPRKFSEDVKFLKEMVSHSSNTAGLADVLGYFLEGPFIALTGAINPDALEPKSIQRLKMLMDASEKLPLVFAVSPEIEGADRFVAEIVSRGSKVFITHTSADPEQTQRAIENGASHATHFYDVFPPPPEKDPGVRPAGAVEAILADPRVSVDFILDGEHVHPLAVKAALACKGVSGVSLVTDANLGAGLPPGRYTGIGGREIEIAYPGGPARGTENSPSPGGLAGSGLTMDFAVKNAVKLLNLSLPRAAAMASKNPAGVIGAEKKGQIKLGYDADLILADNKLNIIKTWIRGIPAYEKKDEEKDAELSLY
jgi:N-acetylglucosamine-6-phosphate deacetylase